MERARGSTAAGPRPVRIVDAGARKPLELTVEVPVEDMARLGDPLEFRSGPVTRTDRPSGAITFEVRTADDPLAHGATVRQMVRQIDSRIAVSDMKTQAAHVDEAISSEIALARLCSFFAALALIVACVGLYGTVAFNVARAGASSLTGSSGSLMTPRATSAVLAASFPSAAWAAASRAIGTRNGEHET